MGVRTRVWACKEQSPSRPHFQGIVFRYFVCKHCSQYQFTDKFKLACPVKRVRDGLVVADWIRKDGNLNNALRGRNCTLTQRFQAGRWGGGELTAENPWALYIISIIEKLTRDKRKCSYTKFCSKMYSIHCIQIFKASLRVPCYNTLFSNIWIFKQKNASRHVSEQIYIVGLVQV